MKSIRSIKAGLLILVSILIAISGCGQRNPHYSESDKPPFLDTSPSLKEKSSFDLVGNWNSGAALQAVIGLDWAGDMCTGTRIGERHILTAKHCEKNKDKIGLFRHGEHVPMFLKIHESTGPISGTYDSEILVIGSDRNAPLLNPGLFLTATSKLTQETIASLSVQPSPGDAFEFEGFGKHEILPLSDFTEFRPYFDLIHDDTRRKGTLAVPVGTISYPLIYHSRVFPVSAMPFVFPFPIANIAQFYLGPTPPKRSKTDM